MTRQYRKQRRAAGWVVGTALLLSAKPGLHAQADASAVSVLLGRARTLEERNRPDLAEQDWAEVLRQDPENAEALAGLERRARAQGHLAEAARLQARLQALGFQASGAAVAKSQAGSAMSTESGTEAALLAEAARLRDRGEPTRALALLQQRYGTHPPPGDAAALFYEAEAATAEGRPPAVAALRALIDQYPSDPRYRAALGKVLLSNPRTRAQGAKLLEGTGAGSPPVVSVAQSSPADRQSPQPKQLLRATPSASVLLAQARTAEQAHRTEEHAALDALRAGRNAEAEHRFEQLLAANPGDAQAAAGLAVARSRSTVADRAESALPSALPRAAQASFPVTSTSGGSGVLAEADSVHAASAGTPASAESGPLASTMDVQGARALGRGDLPGAEVQFKAALRSRPEDHLALAGLGSTLLREEQALAAASVYRREAELFPEDASASLGLLQALVLGGQAEAALELDLGLLPAIKAQLTQRPEYFLALAQAHAEVGHGEEARHVLEAGLDLPAPAPELPTAAKVPYALLLRAAGRTAEAEGMLQRMVKADPTCAPAWVALVAAQHAMGQDAAALRTVGRIPAVPYAAAFAEPGFVTLVAEVNAAEGHTAVAQALLGGLITRQRALQHEISEAAQWQAAAVRLRKGDPVPSEGFPPGLSTQDLHHSSASAAWGGWIAALVRTGHSAAALAQWQAAPGAVQLQMRNDPTVQTAVARALLAEGGLAAALPYFARAQLGFSAQGTPPPAALALQIAGVLLFAHADADLYRELVYLGGRDDLSPQQRALVQQLWAQWAVRRATALAASGQEPRAAETLDAALGAFSQNAEATQVVAEGYTSAGLARQAEARFRAEDMTLATKGEFKAAIGAALAANDLHTAESWVHQALERFPADAQLQLMAGHYEETRGRGKRADAYFRMALPPSPQPNPGARLASELSRPSPELSLLLQLPELSSAAAPASGSTSRPYLPSYNNIPSGLRDSAIPMQSTPPRLTAATSLELDGDEAAALPVPRREGVARPESLSSAMVSTVPGSGQTLRQYVP